MFLCTFSLSSLRIPRPPPSRFCPCRVVSKNARVRLASQVPSQIPSITVGWADSRRFSSISQLAALSKGQIPKLFLGPPKRHDSRLLLAPPAKNNFKLLNPPLACMKDVDVYNGKCIPTYTWPNLHPLIHGIRHHQLFAFSSEVADLCSRPGNELCARARNARLIMSNIIPEMPTDAVTPYCIWYPDIATEETYRELSRRYPRMRYQVGRACAVAGYDNLFDELQLLPDVSIAEEAEDNNNAYIRDAIISKPVRYAVMNDYARTIDIDKPRAGACLNGDTAVRSSLEKKRSHGHDIEERDVLEYSSHYFDIQEDRHVRPEHWRGPEHTVLQSQYADLIYKPLPRDLPPINKDILIIMAAWDGNIDRYSRLRRPQSVENEISAVIRGAYHHTPFARWLETCLEDLFPHESESVLVRQAINARFIMNNDLSRIDRFTHGDSLPEFFWWPHCPHPITLREFAWRRPDMTHQIALACIAGEYRELFDELAVNLKPTAEMWEAAQQCPDEYYREQVKKYADAQGVTLYRIFSAGSHRYLGRMKEMTRTSYLVHLPKELHNTPDEHDEDWEEWDHPAGELFNYHMHSQIADWQTFISAKDDAIELLGNIDGCFYHSSADDLRRRSEPGPEPPFPKKFDSDEDDTDEDDIYTW